MIAISSGTVKIVNIFIREYGTSIVNEISEAAC
jgi:hypothetical protein